MHSVAIGDPQAPLETFLAILAGHGLIGDDGRLATGVHLVSMGDHFDYGRVDDRDQATREGLAVLQWLADQPAEQTTILAGNHDLARVCELESYSDQTFLEAHRAARQLYETKADPTAFLAAHPSIPDTECLARDYSCFSVAQRALVSDLLREGRMRLASAHRGLLLVHAGVTESDLEQNGIAASDAKGTADGLNAFLDRAIARWSGGPLRLEPLHQPGTAAAGEGRGALYHRPCDPSTQPAHRLSGPPRRRFDPRTLPPHFPQAIGHIRDGKCRELMPHWARGESADGLIRSLSIRGADVTYDFGCAEDARLIFIDGGMGHVAHERYQLLDLDRRQPMPRSGRRAT